MAKPIKETPILRGKDAASFIAKIEKNKNRKAEVRDLLSIRKDAQKLRAILRHK